MTGVKRYGLAMTSGDDKASKFSNYKRKLEAIVENKEGTVKRFEELSLEAKLHKSQAASRQVLTDIKQKINQIRIDDEEKVLELNERNLALTEALLGVRVHSVQTVSAMTNENDCLRTWTVLSIPSVKHPDVNLKTTFETFESNDNKDKLPSIHSLRFRLQGLAEKADLVPAVKLCQEESDIQRFSELLKQYLVLNDARQNRIQEASQKQNISRKGNNMLEFRDSEDNILLYLCLNISFDLNTLSWVEAWASKLTAAGTAALANLGLPPKHIEDGSYQDWSVDYAIETLTKMARLGSSPIKQNARSQSGSNSVQDETDSELSGEPETPLPNSKQQQQQSSLSNSQQQSSLSNSQQHTPLASQSTRPPKRRLN